MSEGRGALVMRVLLWVLLAIACVHVVSHEARLLASVLLQCVSYRRCILWLQVALASSIRALCGAF